MRRCRRRYVGSPARLAFEAQQLARSQLLHRILSQYSVADLSKKLYGDWINITDLYNALFNANIGQLLPKASTIPAALKETLSGFLEAANIRVRGLPIAINPLASDVKGVEAVQRNPGQTSNQFTHVMSIVLNEQTNRVQIVSHNPVFFTLPNPTAVEDRMTSVYQQQLDWYPTPMVSSCLSRVIAHLGGVLCRKTGGVYYLPEMALNRFEPLANALESGQGDLAITITKFTLNPGERSYRLVAQSIRREVEEVLLTAPGVAEVSVVGGPDPEWGEVEVRPAAGAPLFGSGHRARPTPARGVPYTYLVYSARQGCRGAKSCAPCANRDYGL